MRKFGAWCAEHGVKGKYSIVPYPACVGWVDRYMPGWSQQELRKSLDLVRELMAPNWDIHPEMVSHTRVIDTKTGRPFEDSSEYFMENWRWTDGKSVDELANYMSYATADSEERGLARARGSPPPAVSAAGCCRNWPRPHCSRAATCTAPRFPTTSATSSRMTRAWPPRVEYASGLGGPDPECVVSIIGCTGDWFGGWDGANPGNPGPLHHARPVHRPNG